MPTRIERLMTLLNVLIGAERPVSVARIRERVPGYPDDSASFQRQFERDKAALREMGLAVEVVDIAGVYPPEVGYRIPSEQAHLRDPGLEPDELAALALATSAVRLDGIEGSGGLWKLGGGARPAGDTGIVDLPADPRLVSVFEAVSDRRSLTFDYRGEPRTMDPLLLNCTRGRWYITGYDHDRGDTRNFRLDRIEGDLELGPLGGFERPAGSVQGVRMEAWRFGSGPALHARVLVDPGHREAVLQAAPTATVVDERADGSVVLGLEVTDPDAFRTLVLGFLDHVEVLGPDELRDDLVAWLEGIVARSAG